MKGTFESIEYLLRADLFKKAELDLGGIYRTPQELKNAVQDFIGSLPRAVQEAQFWCLIHALLTLQKSLQQMDEEKNKKLAFLKLWYKEKGPELLSNEINQEIRDVAKKIDIPFEEAYQFVSDLISDRIITSLQKG